MRRSLVGAIIASAMAGVAYGQVFGDTTLGSDAARAAGALPAATGDAATFRRFMPQVLSDIRAAVALGPIVAVIDTGVNINHVDFNGRIASGAYEIFGGTSNVTDSQGHGTAVASIVVAQQGLSNPLLAPRVLPVKVFSGPSASDQNLSDGIRYSIGRAAIANLSLASSTPIAQSALQDAVAAGQLLIIAAGNQGRSSPDWPARFAADGWSRGQIIAVGAVDATNVIASFSNRAGEARNNFIVAPGVDIPGAAAASTSGRVTMSGTSAAAPIVAGAAAVVLGYWPYLSSAQVASILLSTTTDLGPAGVDETYGRGLLNLERALQPVGTTSIPLASGNSAALSTVSVSPGIATGAGLRAAAARGELVAVALDSYRRAFIYDLGAGVAPAPALTLDQVFGPADRVIGFASRVTQSGGRIIHATDAMADGLALGAFYAYDNRARAGTALAGFAMVEPLGEFAVVSAGTAGMGNTFFGLNAVDLAEERVRMSSGLGLPVPGLMPRHHHVGAGWHAEGGLRLKAGLLSTAGTSALAAQYGIAETTQPSANAMVLEISRPWRHGVIGLSGQQMRESGGYLGMYAGDAFRLAFAPVTTAVTSFARIDLSPNWSVAAQYTSAATSATGNTSESLVSGVTGVRSNAWALGVVRERAGPSGDRWSLSWSQPLRATGGAMALDLPTGVDASGNVIRTARSISLVPSGRERLWELSYTTPLDRRSMVGVTLMHRSDPNHDGAAAAERVIAVRYGLTF